MSSITLLEDRQRALLAEVAVVEAEEARLFARKMALRARMDQLWNTDDRAQEQFGVLELAGTARIGQTRASSQLVNGSRLVDDLPGTFAALQSGELYRETAVLLLELTRSCTSEVVRELERRVLPMILTANSTDVRRLLSTVIPEVEADLDPELTERRLAQAKARRSVWMTDRGEGMVDVTANLDVISAKRWALDFEELVRAQKIADDKAGDVRTADQRRADVFAQLPSRFLALLQAIARGETEQLRGIYLEDPDLADHLEALAGTLPFDVHPVEDLPPVDLSEDLVPLQGPEDVELGMLPDEPPHDPPVNPPADPPQDLVEQVPLLSEPPPDPEQEPGLPDPAMIGHWTELSMRELASTVMGLPVRNPITLLVHTPMSTALELDNRTGRIDQGGAVPASLIRLLLPDADLRRVFVDPDSGVPIGIDPTIHRAHRSANAAPAPDARLKGLFTPFLLEEHAQGQHDPSDRLRRLIELRDQRCTGIGCSQPANRCHLDHEQRYPEGPTAAWNLGAKSARCHRAKHAGWTVTRHGPGPKHGQTTWTSPLGHSYTRLSAWARPPMTWAGCDEVQISCDVEVESYAHAA